MAIILSVITPKFTYHHNNISLKTKLEDIQLLLDKASEESNSFNEDTEVNFYENNKGTIIGCQVGKNLQPDGSVTNNTTILEDYPLEQNWTVSMNAKDIRKIVFKPDHSILFKRADNMTVNDKECQIILINAHSVSGNIKIYALTGEYSDTNL